MDSMPQHSIFPDDCPPDHRLLLEVEDRTLALDDEVRITVRLARLDEDPHVLAIVRLIGVGADYTATACQEITAAWLHGTRHSILAACQSVDRRAKRHAAAHTSRH